MTDGKKAKLSGLRAAVQRAQDITRNPARCVGCGQQLGAPHTTRCPFKRFA
jgi:hypothetical protein